MCITKEKVTTVTSIMRLKQCTYAVAEKHIRDLTALLIANDIYDPEEDCIYEGKADSIIWQDEMGQFFRYMLHAEGNFCECGGCDSCPCESR